MSSQFNFEPIRVEVAAIVNFNVENECTSVSKNVTHHRGVTFGLEFDRRSATFGKLTQTKGTEIDPTKRTRNRPNEKDQALTPKKKHLSRLMHLSQLLNMRFARVDELPTWDTNSFGSFLGHKTYFVMSFFWGEGGLTAPFQICFSVKIHFSGCTSCSCDSQYSHTDCSSHNR